MKPYLNETQCSWWCSREADVFMFYIKPALRNEVKAEIRPYCASCAEFLIRDGSEFHKPFKRDIFLELISRRLAQ